jgi:abortive infection bacteriophage resistance protein
MGNALTGYSDLQFYQELEEKAKEAEAELQRKKEEATKRKMPVYIVNRINSFNSETKLYDSVLYYDRSMLDTHVIPYIFDLKNQKFRKHDRRGLINGIYIL